MKVAPEPGSGRRKHRIRKHRSGKHWRLWVHSLRYLRACLFLLNLRTLALAAFACVMVYLCESTVLDLRFRVEFSIVSTGTVFPLVFSIQQAYQRREEALRNLSILKGALMGTYFCHRDWDLSDGLTVRSNLGNDLSAHAMQCAKVLLGLLTTLKVWLSMRTTYESESEWRMLYGNAHLRQELVHMIVGEFFRGEESRRGGMDSDDSSSSSSSSSDEDEKHEKGAGGKGSMNSRSGRKQRPTRDRLSLDGVNEVTSAEEMTAEEFAETDPHWQMYYRLYEHVSDISILNEQLMVLGGCGKAGEAGFSRLAAYLSKTVEVLERLRCLREYRTPFMLRYVNMLLIIITIVIAAPYFSWMCAGTKWDADINGTCPAGYLTAILFVLVVSTLYHIQVSLENPFDGIGMDDVLFNMDREFVVTVRRYSRARSAAAAAAVAAEAAKKAPVAEAASFHSEVKAVGVDECTECRGVSLDESAIPAAAANGGGSGGVGIPVYSSGAGGVTLNGGSGAGPFSSSASRTSSCTGLAAAANGTAPTADDGSGAVKSVAIVVSPHLEDSEDPEEAAEEVPPRPPLGPSGTAQRHRRAPSGSGGLALSGSGVSSSVGPERPAAFGTARPDSAASSAGGAGVPVGSGSNRIAAGTVQGARPGSAASSVRGAWEPVQPGPQQLAPLDRS